MKYDKETTKLLKLLDKQCAEQSRNWKPVSSSRLRAIRWHCDEVLRLTSHISDEEQQEEITCVAVLTQMPKARLLYLIDNPKEMRGKELFWLKYLNHR